MSEKASLWLFIFIDNVAYRVRRMTFDDPRIVGWKLTKFVASAETYSVIRHDGVITCDCPDFVMQREKRGEYCKHCSALIQVLGEFL
jgi:predicted nucleic acid-binding Zn finger protein